MSGYVRIHRSLFGHPAFRNESETMAFAWLIMKAAWQDTRVRYKGHDITLRRGEVSISIRDFAEAMDRPKGWAERLFERLIEHEMIEKSRTQVRTEVRTRIGTHGGTIGGTPPAVITICNYDKYQAGEQERRTPNGTSRGTGRETRAGQQQDTEQRREESKKEELAKPTRVKPAEPELPDDLAAIMHEAKLASPPDRRILQSWYDLGASLNYTILPVIRSVMARGGKQPGTLKYFDPMIREKIAADEAEAAHYRRIARRYEAEAATPEEKGIAC